MQGSTRLELVSWKGWAFLEGECVGDGDFFGSKNCCSVEGIVLATGAAEGAPGSVLDLLSGNFGETHVVS